MPPLAQQVGFIRQSRLALPKLAGIAHYFKSMMSRSGMATGIAVRECLRIGIIDV